MAEEEEKAVAEVKRGESVGERGSDPEIGSTRGPIDLPAMAADAIYDGFLSIVKAIVKGIEAGNLPAAKLLIELSHVVNGKKEVPAATYQSVAEVLWKSYQEQGKE